MIRILAFLAACLLPAILHAGLTFKAAPGSGPYVALFDGAEHTECDFTEGTGMDAGNFEIADAALVTASLNGTVATPITYAGRLYNTNAATLDSTYVAANAHVAEFAGFIWNGANQVNEFGEIIDAIEDIEGGGSADNRDLGDVDHVWELRRTGNGTLRSTNPLYISPGDTRRVAWNCKISGVLPGGTYISVQENTAEVTATGDLTTTHTGHDRTLAKCEIEAEADATPTDDPDTNAIEGHWIKTQITNSDGGGPINVYGLVVVQEEPE